MKPSIHLWQFEVIPARPDLNTKTMIEMIRQVPEGELIVFPEMAIPWYLIGDLWLKESFVRECESFNQRILCVLKECQNSAIWGNISLDPSKKNADSTIRKYNSAILAQNGKIIGETQKLLLPNYRMFDDERYFSALSDKAFEDWISVQDALKTFEIVITWVKKRVGILICEDIWNINWDYAIEPVGILKEKGIDLLAVPSCSPFGLDKDILRKKILSRHSLGIELAYVNPIGTQNNGKNIFSFDGGSALFEDGNLEYAVDDHKAYQPTQSEVNTHQSLNHKTQVEQIYETLIYNIKNFFGKIHATKCVIGLSGGIDSGLVATLVSQALWSENVIGINMPSRFNSDTTKWLAKKLAENLSIAYHVFPIQEAVDLKIKQMQAVSGKTPSSFEIENIQARERGQILADMAAHFGAVFSNNGNKDETALGYATLYGDVAWAFAPIADLSKVKVYALSRYINELHWKEIIPEVMINIKPSAELSDSQNPESGGWDPFDYNFLSRLNDFLLEKKMMPEDILRIYIAGSLEKMIGYEGNIKDLFANDEDFIRELEKIWTLLHRAYFKRIQAPPIFTITRSSFGFDYRESQIDAYFWQSYQDLKSTITS